MKSPMNVFRRVAVHDQHVDPVETRIVNFSFEFVFGRGPRLAE